MRTLALVLPLLVAGACVSTKTVSQATSDPAATPLADAAAASSDAAGAACVQPRADALARLGPSAADAGIELRESPEDLDDDGTKDVILRVVGGQEHFLYVTRGACALFVGNVRAAFLWVDETKHEGFHDLSMDTWLFHGDRARRTVRFHAGHYDFEGAMLDPGELVPGPHKK